jgi:hypothetical protein
MEVIEWTKESLTQKIAELTAIKNELKNEEQAVKLTMNSIYGAVGNSYFICMNPDVAEAVTLQGQDLIKFAEKIINKYFQEHWHKDTELHEKLGVSGVKRVVRPLVIYIDTDSADGETMVDVKMGDGERLKLKFKDLFNLLKEGNDVHYDERGNEILTPEIKVKNFKDDLVGYSDVRRLIRHKVTKEKWLLKTVSGKEVIVTGDHSLTVVRNGKKITLKPKDVNIHTDYIIEVI